MRGQLASLADSAKKLTEALAREEPCRAALGSMSLDSLAADLAALGSDPLTALKGRRQTLIAALGTARATEAKASTDSTLAEERRRTSQAVLEAAIVTRDAELARFPDSLTTELSAAQTAAAGTSEEQKTVAALVASLESTIAEQTSRIEAEKSGARAAVGPARAGLELTEAARTTVLKEHAAEGGRLEALRKQRESQDLQSAETKLREVSDRHGALPVPGRIVTEAEVTGGAQRRGQREG